MDTAGHWLGTTFSRANQRVKMKELALLVSQM